MSEREGSLVKMTEMDEPLFYRRSQNCVPSTEDERYTASPGCERRHGQKVRKGTREVLAGPTEKVREELPYKETKAEEAGRCRSRHAASYNRYNVGAAMADETVVLRMFCESRAEGRVSTDTQQPKELSQKLMRLWRRRRVHCES